MLSRNAAPQKKRLPSQSKHSCNKPLTKKRLPSQFVYVRSKSLTHQPATSAGCLVSPFLRNAAP